MNHTGSKSGTHQILIYDSGETSICKSHTEVNLKLMTKEGLHQAAKGSS